jgi:hypothetical protein
MPPLPPSSPPRRARLEWQIGLFLVNLPLMVLLAFAAWQWRRPPVAAPAQAAPAASQPTPAAIAQPSTDYSRKSATELEHLLQEKQKQLGNTSPATIDQAAKLIGLAPATPPAKTGGPFDFKRSTVQSFEKVVAKDGRYGYRITFVDDAGAVCPVEIPPDEVSSSEDTAYSLYERAKNDPTFKKLLDLAVKKIMTREK